MSYLIIETRTIWHEGDERSRTHPGHGYPAYSEEVKHVEEIADIVTLKARITKLQEYRRPFVVYEAKRLEVTSEVVINVV